MKNNSRFVLGTAVVLLALWVACARQGFPPGGPVDRTPPHVVRTYPQSGAVRVPLDAVIEVEFNERVRPGTVEDALFLSPAPLEPLRLKWKGRRLRIRVPGGLRPDRTYVLTIGAGARDLRNNMMRESVLLAFSTGDSLDRGEIGGWVFSADGPAAGVLVAAYDLAEQPQPDPARDAADYFSQTGEDGRFDLGYLRRSRYRVFAWKDRDANRLWGVGDEDLGVPWRDVSLLDSLRRGGVLLRLAALDTLPPRAVDARSPDSRHVDVRLSEPADLTRSAGWSAVILRPDGGRVVPSTAFLDDRNPDRLHLVTGEDLSGSLSLVLRGLADAWGNRAESDTLRFDVEARPDTSRPRLAESIPADSSRAILPRQRFDIWFSEAVDTAGTLRAVALLDTAGESLPVTATWHTPAHLSLNPSATLPARCWLRLTLDGPRFRDFAGNALADSTVTLWFQAVQQDTLSSISGRITDQRPDGKGPVHLILRRPQGDWRREIVLPAPGPYLFRDLFPGLYVLELYRDRNGDGQWSPGWTRPFEPAERYVVYPDTIKVRARWANEGNDFAIPW